jgi:hypothetical protein
MTQTAIFQARQPPSGGFCRHAVMIAQQDTNGLQCQHNSSLQGSDLLCIYFSYTFTRVQEVHAQQEHPAICMISKAICPMYCGDQKPPGASHDTVSTAIAAGCRSDAGSVLHIFHDV